MVQGHIDTTIVCDKILKENGSWRVSFKGKYLNSKLIVNKGSISINGVSLTIAELDETSFEVAIIPYTYENTNFKTLNEGDHVNLEYDILGKYIIKNIAN